MGRFVVDVFFFMGEGGFVVFFFIGRGDLLFPFLLGGGLLFSFTGGGWLDYVSLCWLRCFPCKYYYIYYYNALKSLHVKPCVLKYTIVFMTEGILFILFLYHLFFLFYFDNGGLWSDIYSHVCMHRSSYHKACSLSNSET